MDLNCSAYYSYGGIMYGNLQQNSTHYNVAVCTQSIWNMIPSTNPVKYEIIYKGSPVVDILHKYTFDWGGEWNSQIDPMHFTFLGGGYSRNQIKMKDGYSN